MIKITKGHKNPRTREKSMKKLYLSDKNRVIAGVCGGIGEYFNIDPTIIRLLWVLSVFFMGTGILAYFIFWIIMPEKK